MKSLLREERQPIEIASGGDAEEGITENQLKRLVATWRAATGRDPGRAFEYGEGVVKPTNWIGAVSTGDLVVEVVPRGALALGEEDRRRLDRNIGEMLHLALGVEPLSFGAGEVSLGGSRFERAVEALCELIRSARRKQVIRQYAVREEIVWVPRGQIRFPAQVGVAIGRPGSSACRWVELSEDTPENRFLKAALSMARGRVGGNLRRQVDEVLVAFDQVREPGDPRLEYERINFGRLPVGYGEAIELGNSLLGGAAVGILAGTLASRSEVLFLPDLFQGFVERLAQEYAASHGIGCRSQLRGRRFARWRSGPFQGHELIELIPDVELVDLIAGGPIGVVDAKWKAISPGAGGLGLSAGDVHQMAAYAIRLGYERAALVYPSLGREPPFATPPVMELGSEPPIELMVISISLLWAELHEVIDGFCRDLDLLLAH